MKEKICNLSFGEVYKLLGYSDLNNLEIEKAYYEVQELLVSRKWDLLVGRRFSWLFIIGLVELKLKNSFIFAIINEIEYLENLELSKSITKSPSLFDHKPLKGLWHKHYHLGDFKNIKIMYLDRIVKGKKWGQIKQECRALEKKKKKGDSNLKLVFNVLKKHTIDHYGLEMEKSALTGEWIIYHEYRGKKYYLALCDHDVNEKIIANEIKVYCKSEFPEFINQLPIFQY